MEEKKHFSINPFDLFIYDGNGLIFKIDSASKCNFMHSKSGNFFTVRDVSIDIDLFNRIFRREFDGKVIGINGESTFRDNTGKDVNVRFNISVAKLMDYSLNTFAGKSAVVSIVFDFPAKTESGERNVNMFLEDSKVEHDEGFVGE